jgi:hypothetical protein
MSLQTGGFRHSRAGPFVKLESRKGLKEPAVSPGTHILRLIVSDEIVDFDMVCPDLPDELWHRIIPLLCRQEWPKRGSDVRRKDIHQQDLTSMIRLNAVSSSRTLCHTARLKD